MRLFGPFLSTPSARRATGTFTGSPAFCGISIHALREEGDKRAVSHWYEHRYFYPRPPRGGRRGVGVATQGHFVFLSTPSARRATGRKLRRGRRHNISIHALREEGDLHKLPGDFRESSISIHALREEGDFINSRAISENRVFLSTPSARRATVISHVQRPPHRISIHALREEGDGSVVLHHQRGQQFLSTPSARRATDGDLVRVGIHEISIHALREEGDYEIDIAQLVAGEFLSTPSARRATHALVVLFCPVVISIHALREEGDR